VYMILDEFILAGEIQETSKKARRRRSSRDTLRSAPPRCLVSLTPGGACR
jgi:hypothetical protein